MTPADLTPDLFGAPALSRSQQCIAAARHYAVKLPHAKGGAKPLQPRDEVAELQRRGQDLVRELQAVCDRLERTTQPPLQAVSGGKG